MKKTLTIGIDCRDLLKASTGTKTYLSELIEQFKQYPTFSVRFVYLHDPLPLLAGKSYLHKFIEHILFFCLETNCFAGKSFFKGM